MTYQQVITALEETAGKRFRRSNGTKTVCFMSVKSPGANPNKIMKFSEKIGVIWDPTNEELSATDYYVCTGH